ncbi:hypothetical protein SAMN05421770_11915 [Granulicella rosea]|uniref:Uncharacterized protein n=1 Tax=Granulicella rosea TaxID=474952 RepID=A0A239MPM4_9BACT|nr:hypothetical protein [Granulicella rosea]SNT44440.1 hypothetical protein SAMN05421770_11915 [Granulicella rosea]
MTEKIIFVGIIVAGLIGFVLALWAWVRSEQSKELPAWRRLLFSLGFLAVAGQVVLFALSWTHIGRNRALFSAWARFVYPSFFVAAILALTGKGAARWWLLASSFLLFVLCFFIMLSP